VSEVVGQGTVLSGRYRVTEQGTCDVPGMSVWHATDQILDRPVRAVVLSSGEISAALDGARRAALVSDPRLARVLDVGTHERFGYVVTEDVTGPTLAELVARAPLTPEQARAVVGEAATALEVARRRGLHHLALRPRALHLVGPGRVVLTGLGIDAAVLGVADGDARTTSRRDAVDLVRLLYTALTGRWPATSRDAVAPGVPTAPISDGVAVPPADLVAGTPNDLDTLCAVTLGPHDDGPRTPGDLVRELEPWGAIRAVQPGAAPAAAAGPAPAHEGADVTDDRAATDHGATGAPDGASDPTEVLPGAAATTPLPPTGPGTSPAGIRPATPEDDLQDTAPIQVQRQSVRSVFGDDPTAVSRPGTPPPAAPLRASAFGPTPVAPAVGSVPPRVSALPPITGGPVASPAGPAIPLGSVQMGVAPAGAPGTPPPAVPPAGATGPTGPAGSTGPTGGGGWQGDDFSSVMGEIRDEPPTRRSFDPTALVLAVVGIGVVIGVVLAFKALFSSLDTGAPEPRPVASSAQETTDSAEEPTQGATTPEAEESTAAASTAPPVITSATSVDPSDDDGEHEEAVARAFDGDTSTYWYTMTYQQSNFSGFKDRVGFVMTLQEPALVSKVVMNTSSTGGKFEIRAGGKNSAADGELLGSGSFSPDLTLDLDKPTETDTITLWVTDLPTAADGSFRLELNEISFE